MKVRNCGWVHDGHQYELADMSLKPDKTVVLLNIISTIRIVRMTLSDVIDL